VKLVEGSIRSTLGDGSSQGWLIGKKNHSSTYKYSLELADHSNQIISAAILSYLDSQSFLDPAKYIVSKEEGLEAVKNATAMPDWPKAMAV